MGGWDLNVTTGVQLIEVLKPTQYAEKSRACWGEAVKDSARARHSIGTVYVLHMPNTVDEATCKGVRVGQELKRWERRERRDHLARHVAAATLGRAKGHIATPLCSRWDEDGIGGALGERTEA